MIADITDVLIVGAGPAGSVLACLLAERGLDVTLLERSAHPRPKPCGELLNPGAVRALERVGLLERVLALQPAVIEGWRLRTDRSAPAEGRYGRGRVGLSVARERLDATLAGEATRRGADLQERVQVRRVTPAGGTRLPVAETVEADGSRGRRTARVVVGADGLRSMVAAAINPDRPRASIRKVSLTCRVQGRLADQALGRLHISERGTVGASAVHADGRHFNVTVVVGTERGRRGVIGDPLDFFRACLEEAHLPWLESPEVLGGPWASGPFDRPIRHIVDDGVVLVGDAAGYFDPLTGQGLFRAFRGAEMAAEHLTAALRDTAGAPERRQLGAYAGDLRRAFRPGRSVQRLVEAVVSRPRARKRAIEGLARSASAADRLIRVTGDIAPVHSLVRPSLLAAVAGLGVRR